MVEKLLDLLDSRRWAWSSTTVPALVVNGAEAFLGLRNAGLAGLAGSAIRILDDGDRECEPVAAVELCRPAPPLGKPT